MNLIPLPTNEAQEWVARFADRWGLQIYDDGWPSRLESGSQQEIAVFSLAGPPPQRSPGSWWVQIDTRAERRFEEVARSFALRTGATSLIHLSAGDAYIVEPFQFAEDTEQSKHFPISLDWAIEWDVGQITVAGGSLLVELRAEWPDQQVR